MDDVMNMSSSPPSFRTRAPSRSASSRAWNVPSGTYPCVGSKSTHGLVHPRASTHNLDICTSALSPAKGHGGECEGLFLAPKSLPQQRQGRLKKPALSYGPQKTCASSHGAA